MIDGEQTELVLPENCSSVPDDWQSHEFLDADACYRQSLSHRQDASFLSRPVVTLRQGSRGGYWSGDAVLRIGSWSEGDNILPLKASIADRIRVDLICRHCVLRSRVPFHDLTLARVRSGRIDTTSDKCDQDAKVRSCVSGPWSYQNKPYWVVRAISDLQIKPELLVRAVERHVRGMAVLPASWSGAEDKWSTDIKHLGTLGSDDCDPGPCTLHSVADDEEGFGFDWNTEFDGAHLVRCLGS